MEFDQRQSDRSFLCFNRLWSKWSIIDLKKRFFGRGGETFNKKCFFEKKMFSLFWNIKQNNFIMIKWSIIRMINHFPTDRSWSLINLIDDRLIDRSWSLNYWKHQLSRVQIFKLPIASYWKYELACYPLRITESIRISKTLSVNYWEQ